jgi:hypothetical protein
MMAGWLARLNELFSGDSGQAWTGPVEELLFDGESVKHRTEIGDNEVVVTSHRLLAFTPETDGENFRQIDRPNVQGVSAGADGEDTFIQQGVQTLGIAIVLLLAGQFISLDSLVSGVDLGGSAAGRMGLGGLMGMLTGLLNLLAMLDELMTMFGALAVILAMVIFVVYLLTRDRVLVIAVAGGDDILVPAPKETAEAAAVELESALFEGGAAPESDPLDAEPADAGFKSDDPL